MRTLAHLVVVAVTAQGALPLAWEAIHHGVANSSGARGAFGSSSEIASSPSSPSAPSPSPDPLPETDWFAAAGRGVFTHYLSSLQNNFGRNSQGQNSTWDECVREFDADAYAASAAAAGARYAVITMMQGDRFMIAPNAVYDNFTGYAAGDACATRDLVLDVHAALSARGLRLMLYWTGDGPHFDEQARTGLGWPDGVHNPTTLFVERWASVLQECVCACVPVAGPGMRRPEDGGGVSGVHLWASE
jgi:hypothetical protein